MSLIVLHSVVSISRATRRVAGDPLKGSRHGADDGRRQRSCEHVGAARDAQEIEILRVRYREAAYGPEALTESAADKINIALNISLFADTAALLTSNPKR